MLRGRVKWCRVKSFNVRIKLGFWNVGGSTLFKVIDTAVTEEGMSGIEILLVESVVDTKNGLRLCHPCNVMVVAAWIP